MLLLAIVLWVQKKSIAFGVDDGKSSIIDLHIKVSFLYCRTETYFYI